MPIRWHKTLALRLAVMINLVAAGVLGSFWAFDAHRERKTHLKSAAARLEEEARLLAATRPLVAGERPFQQYVDTFCEQMNVAASPGHHILVLDGAGRIEARAHVRPDPVLEQAMIAAHKLGAFEFTWRDQPYIGFAARDPTDGYTIVLAQSLEPVEALVRAQTISRAVSLAILMLLISALTGVVLLVSLWRPLRSLVRGVRRIGQGDFTTRIAPRGSIELTVLATGINDMAAALERVERRRNAEMRRAREIQQRLLPETPIGRHGWHIAAAFEPAESVGGDLFDIIELPAGGFIVAVWDVSGHGVPGALYTALLRTVLRQQIRHNHDPLALLEALNAELRSVVGDSGQFATGTIVRLEPGQGRLHYVSAGHPPALIVGPDGTRSQIAGDGLILGVAETTGATVRTARIDPRQRLFLFTDGLLEASAADGDQFGVERLGELLGAFDVGRDAGTAHLRQVIEHVRAYTGRERFDDDVTVVEVRRAAGAGACERGLG